MREEEQPRKECEVYDDLSQFIQIFKKAVTHIELTAVSIQKGHEYAHLLEGVKRIANSIHPIWEKYSRDTSPLPIDPMYAHSQIVLSTGSCAGWPNPSTSTKSNTRM